MKTALSSDILKNRVKWSDTNPGFIFDFLIHDQFNQQLQVDVYDKDADWDDHLGGFTIDIISGKNQSWDSQLGTAVMKMDTSPPPSPCPASRKQ